MRVSKAPQVKNRQTEWDFDKDGLSTVPNRFELIFTPTHGSWLNVIESFFGKLAKVLLRGIRVQSTDELKRRIELYLQEVNQEPVVYRWKYQPKSTSVT